MPGQSGHFLTLELEASKKNPFYRDNGDCHNLINNRICSSLGVSPFSRLLITDSAPLDIWLIQFLRRSSWKKPTTLQPIITITPALSFWDRFGRRTVERLPLAPGMNVLDVCCGMAGSALPAAERVGSELRSAAWQT